MHFANLGPDIEHDHGKTYKKTYGVWSEKYKTREYIEQIY